MLNPDFKEFAELLNAHRVEYLVVGGYALAAHGHPRYTGDMDFWLARNAGDIDGLALNFIGLDDFKANKRASGRNKDLPDLDALDDTKD